MKNSGFYFLFVITILTGCGNPEDTSDLKSGVNKTNSNRDHEIAGDWIGTTFPIPDSLEIILDDNNLLIPTRASTRNSEWKIVAYINGDCGSCVSQLKKWEILLKKWKKEINIEELIFIGTKNIELFKFILYEKKFYEGELVFDRSEEIINYFPKSKFLQVFLLKNNKVFLVGDPTDNKEVEALYEKTFASIKCD